MRLVRGRLIAAGILAALTFTPGVIAQMQPIDSGSVVAAVERLRPGQYIWAPQLAPQGPMLVVVNIATQRLIAYRNGIPIAVSTVSTGRAGHRTPTGIFTILQKREEHYSSIYNRAPMPFMQRLTWGGIALHGGNLPGYPASHGCVRLPHEFAKLLFSETALGMTVVVVNQPALPRVAPGPALLRSPGARATTVMPTVWRPELSPSGPVSIVVSAPDRRMVVLRNGIEIGSAPVAFDGEVDSLQAYVLQSIDGGEYRWGRVALPGQSAPPAGVMPAVSTSQQGTDPFRQALASVVRPGTTMIVLPDSFGPGFVRSAPMTVIENEPPRAPDVAAITNGG
ncbi:L,D-transpeptidase family protein [Sphingomonas canadensis]|uniref:L,D-transpeptidase family protein n=1 Tax=Sphingomonas canadensis TaxID=1219257 RepID=A0ABW3H077_9SPHN|nr:L,D-transpeptidase family protein [Sphingomonas canadensis]MCW3835213.1 L,D-transpeptidase family protein [Sphingomonas canadensis]